MKSSPYLLWLRIVGRKLRCKQRCPFCPEIILSFLFTFFHGCKYSIFIFRWRSYFYCGTLLREFKQKAKGFCGPCFQNFLQENIVLFVYELSLKNSSIEPIFLIVHEV